MPKIFTTARQKKPQRLIPATRKSGPTVSSHFVRAENSSSIEEKEDFGMFDMKRNKQPSLPSLSTLLSSDIKLPRIEEPQPRPKAKKCAKKDIFVGKNLKDCDDETSPLKVATKERNEFDISNMFTDGLSDEENIGEEFKYVVDSQDSDTERRGRREKETRPGNRKTLGKIETANFYPRSNPSKKIKKSLKTATQISSSGLRPNGAAAPLAKPRIIENVKIADPFTVRVEKRASNRILETNERENSDREIVDDFEFDTDSLCSSMQSIFSGCNIGLVDPQDISNRPTESLTIGKTEFVDKPTAALDSEITEGFKLSPRYAMLPECKSPIIRGGNTCFAQKYPGENSVTVQIPEIDRKLEDTDLFSDSGTSHYSEIFSQPSYSYNPHLRVGSQLSGLSKTSLPPSEEFKLSPRYSKPCGSINRAFDLSQSQYLQRRRSFQRSNKTNDSTTFKFNLCNSAAREIEEFSQKDHLALAQSNSNVSLKRRRSSETNVNILNVEINNTYNGCDRVDELSSTCSNLSNSSLARSRSTFPKTVHEVRYFVGKWLNKQDERNENRDGEMITIEENICTDPESLFANYSCEYIEASFLRRFKPQQY